MNKKTLLFLGMLALLFIVLSFGKWTERAETDVRITALPYLVQPKKGTQGVSGRISLPPSQRLLDVKLESLSRYTLPQLNPEEVGQKRNTRPNILGEVRPVPASVDSFARWYEVPGGEQLSLAAITSPGAFAVSLHFVSVNLPEGAALYVYSPRAPDRIEGPFFKRGPFGDGDFWTGDIFDDTVVIEYAASIPQAQATPQLPFQLREISHWYGRPQTMQSTPCEDKPCYEAAGCYTQYSAHRKATGLLVVPSGNDLAYCSGTLLNNKRADFTPYFLTANHCVSSNEEARAARVYWFYEAPCNGNPPEISQFGSL